MPKVSIIIPVYNVEKYIKKCLDSLVNQTLEDIEIIVVNDGSPDNSQKIIDDYVKKYPKLVKSYIKENGGQGSARNYGVKCATGEYIGFVDSDDYVDKNMYKIMYEKAKETESDIVCCNHYEVRNEELIEKKYYNDIKSDSNITKYILGFPCPWNKLIKRDLIVKNKWAFPEKIWYEDYAAIPLLALYANKITDVEEHLYYYLIREGSTMHRVGYNKKYEDIFVATDFLIKKLSKYKNKYKDEFEFLLVENYLRDGFFRFLYNDGEKKHLDRISNEMHKYYPDWKSNKYVNEKGFLYKFYCSLIYNKKYNVIVLINNLKNRKKIKYFK